jgi:hypothetical protein
MAKANVMNFHKPVSLGFLVLRLHINSVGNMDLSVNEKKAGEIGTFADSYHSNLLEICRAAISGDSLGNR